MEIILVARDVPLARAWGKFCGDLEGVSVHLGSILEVRCDAVVSPANSFGFMDGGIDLLNSNFFGWHVQERLQTLIKERHHGELLVGTAEIVETDNAMIPYLIAAPTMRVPMILRDSVNPYLAARAAILLAKHGKAKIERLAFPGLGTGVGRVPPEICAQQMRAAIEEVLLNPAPFPASWWEAAQRHQRLYGDHPRDLQFDG
ncbi:MAG: macro domain-containing protein [Ardenticatenales bacterium]|nr:macro domain-containing protein [Ardenticatenales bacterium]